MPACFLRRVRTWVDPDESGGVEEAGGEEGAEGGKNEVWAKQAEKKKAGSLRPCWGRESHRLLVR